MKLMALLCIFLMKKKVEGLAKQYKNLIVNEFEEGELPRKLYEVVMKK